MKIQELYDRDITRRIAPAVVVSQMNDDYINQEIEEYIFTSGKQGITTNIYSFLNAIAFPKIKKGSKKTDEANTGVWINGYYGSGKSHFIKYLFYCLNKQFSTKAFENFIEAVRHIDPLEEPNIGQVTSLQRKLKELDVAEIIFNIDAVSENDGVKDRITRVLLNRLNFFRGFNDSNIALALYLEKPLSQKGYFESFKDKVKSSFNETWDGNQLRFARMYLDKVIEIAKEFDTDIDKESLKSSILDRNQDYTIDFLIRELQDFLIDKSEAYRLVFLIDEVSQYIGSNTSLLLNLQTIVEEIGSQIGPMVWIVCTAQQDLSNLISNTDSKTEDFGKILGRFETRISLESQDAAYITKRRILEKKSDGIGALNDFYKQNKGAIENQFVFDHDLYENYENREDFTLTYPFIPYQFRLISDVFESFSQVGYVGEGVKNTERAILGITHYTANICKEQDLGYFVPFDLFFNEQLEKNLTHHARGILDRAYNIDQVKKEVFPKKVVNALFMISNLGESQSVNFPATVENLALLLMENVNTPKLEMQTKVQQILDVLVSKNIIQVSEGKYRFLKEDEIEVAHLIKTTPVTNDDRLTYIYDDIISKIIKPNQSFSFGGKNFRYSINIDDKEIGAKGDFNVRFTIFDSTPIENLAHSTPSQDLVLGISDWFNADKELKNQVSDYVRTQKYIRLNSSNATGTRTETLVNFRETNLVLLGEIKMRFEKKFAETTLVSNNQLIQSNEITGSTASIRFDEMIKRHMSEIYRKLSLSSGYATTSIDLLTNAKQISTRTELTHAEEELNAKLNLMGEGMVVGDIVKQFEKPPYGWKDISTLDILLRLAKNGLRRFEWRNDEIDLVVFAEKAVNTRERDAITIFKEKVHSQEETKAFIKALNDEIFVETLVPSDINDFKEAVDIFKKKLQDKLITLNRLKDEYEQYPFASNIKIFHKNLAEIYNTRNPEQVVSLVVTQKVQLKALRDAYMYVEEFLDNNFKGYEQIVHFADQNKNNFTSLEDELLEVKAKELQDFVKTDQEPWEKFPQMKKAFKELNDAISTKVSIIQDELQKNYETVFNEIEKRKVELTISETHLTPERDYFLRRIQKEDQITQLENYQLKLNDFRAENFKKLEDFKAQQEAKKSGGSYVTSVTVSVVNEMPPTTIETPEQLDEYIKKLRERLMVQLAKNKKIWLN